MTLNQAPQKGEEGYGLYMWLIEQSESDTDVGVKQCPTCGDHDFTRRPTM